MMQTLSRLVGIRPAPQTLAKRYNRAADKWHDAMHKYGQMTAHADLVRQAEPKLPKSQNGEALAVLDAGADTRWHHSAVRLQTPLVHRHRAIHLAA